MKELGGGKVRRVEAPLFSGANGALKMAKRMPKNFWQILSWLTGLLFNGAAGQLNKVGVAEGVMIVNAQDMLTTGLSAFSSFAGCRGFFLDKSSL